MEVLYCMATDWMVKASIHLIPNLKPYRKCLVFVTQITALLEIAEHVQEVFKEIKFAGNTNHPV